MRFPSFLFFIAGCGAEVGTGAGQPPGAGGGLTDDGVAVRPREIAPREPRVFRPQGVDREVGVGPSVGGGPFPLAGGGGRVPGDAAQDEGVVPDPGAGGALALGTRRSLSRSLWIAQSDQGTVSKIDSKTIREVARYATVTCFSNPGGSRAACDGQNGCCAADDYERFRARRGGWQEPPRQRVEHVFNAPSRTAVDRNGDLYVANRAFGGQSSVTKIAGDPADCKERNGVPGVQTSVDADGDGLIETDCDRDGRLDDAAGLRCANGRRQEFFGLDDECVLWTSNVDLPLQIGRPLALGPPSDERDARAPASAWAGGYLSGRLFRLDGASGRAEAEVQLPKNDCLPYGLAVDAGGIGWAPNLGAGLCYFDARAPANAARVRDPDPKVGVAVGYGVALDRDQNVWVGGAVARYTPRRGAGFAALGQQGVWTLFPEIGGTGIAVDSRSQNAYFAWACDGLGQIRRISASAVPVPARDARDLTAYLTLDARCYGVGVDSDQNLWGVDFLGATRIRVDAAGRPEPPRAIPPAPGTRCPAGDSCDTAAGAYTYSDFTGFGLQNFTFPRGVYRYLLPGCGEPPGSLRASWRSVAAEVDAPPGTSVDLRARSGDGHMPDDGSWSGWSSATPAGGGIALHGVHSAYLQVEFALATRDARETPRLRGFRIAFRCPLP